MKNILKISFENYFSKYFFKKKKRKVLVRMINASLTIPYLNSHIHQRTYQTINNQQNIDPII